MLEIAEVWQVHLYEPLAHNAHPQLYTQRFGELVAASNIMSAFVQAVWEIVSGGNYRSVGDDGLVAQCMRFLSSTIKSGHHKDIFGSRETISGLVEKVIIPNVQIRGMSVTV